MYGEVNDRLEAWEHTFLTAQPNARIRFRRAIERRASMAEDAARELPNLTLEDALQLVHLYAERGSPKYERAALRWLERYLAEGSPRLGHFAGIAASLASESFSGREWSLYGSCRRYTFRARTPLALSGLVSVTPRAPENAPVPLSTGMR